MPLFKTVNPVLPVRDVQAAVAYFTTRLGFRLLFQDDANAPKYAGVARDGATLHLQWHDEGDFADGDQAAMRFVVDDVDGLFAEYADKDVFHERTALQDTPWGTREFAFYDRDGNGLFFYRSLTPPQAEPLHREKANLAGSLFNDVNLAGTRFVNVNLADVVFNDVNLRGAVFNNVALTRASIRDACLGEASIAEAGYAGMTIEGIPVTELLRVYRERETA